MIEYLKPFDEALAKKNDLDLIEAAKIGHTEEVITLLEEGANIDFVDLYGRTALHWAAENGHTPTVNFLLEKKANTDITCNDGLKPLHRAIMKNHKETVKSLIKDESNVNYMTTFGRAAIHMAAVAGYTTIAKDLLEKGADVGLKDSSGLTAIELASSYNETDTVDLLTSYVEEEKGKQSNSSNINTEDTTLAVNLDALAVRPKVGIETKNNVKPNTQKRSYSPTTISNTQKKSAKKRTL